LDDLLAGWGNFFVAQVSAAAALAGLLFVAVSINLTRIIEIPNLTVRAFEGLLFLFAVLVISSLALIPGQSANTFGVEVVISGGILWVSQTIALARTWRREGKYHPTIRVVFNQIPPLPIISAGVQILAGRAVGIYWLVPGILLCIFAGILGAWVLLIEILR
jgi:modulator of FtsH protease